MVKCVEEALSPPLRLGSRRVILGATSLADTNQAALSISGEVRGVSMRKSAQAKIEKSETGKSSDWGTVFSISIKVLADIVRVRLGAEHSKDVRFPARPDARWRSLVFQAQRIGRSVYPLNVDARRQLRATAVIARPRKWRFKSTLNPLAIAFSLFTLTDNV
jgi:hypothetical protein